MRIVTTSTAYPPYYFTQQQVAGELCRYWEHAVDTAVIERLHSRTGVDGRYFSRPLADYYTLDTWGKANNVWIETALDLGERAIECLIRQSGIDRAQIGAIFFVSVTGIASPSVDARLVNRLQLSPHIRRNPIFGLGCVAGAAGLARAADYVKAYPDQYAVLLSVELCSLTWQRGDVSVANLISSGLFGDGAAAALVAGDQAQPAATVSRAPRILDHYQVFYPNTEYVMGWDISELGFQIVLSPDVPRVVRDNLRGDVDRFLAGHGLTRADIGCWIMHTGGPKVLEASEDALGLARGALALSSQALRRVGNLSSASVLVVLDDVMKQHRPAPGTKSVLAAMGPGFCCEMLLLEW